jgi:hypothetical protein
MAKKVKKFQADYTADDVLALYRQRRDDADETRFRTLAYDMRALVKLEHAVDIPEQYKAITKEFRTPYVRDSWHRVTASLLNKPPVIHIEPIDDKRKEFRESTAIAERFDLAAIERMNKSLGTDVIYESTAALVRDGQSVIKFVHRPDAWANFPERGEGEDPDDYQARADNYKRGVDLPFAWRVVDRLATVWDDGEFGDSWVIEYGEYARPYLRSRYGMRDGEDDRLVSPETMLSGQPSPEGDGTRGTSGRSIKLEFWTAKEWHVVIDGVEAPGFPKANPYAPNLPYLRATAYESESLLYSLLFLVPGLDSILTMKANWAYLGAYPNPIISTVPNQLLPGLEGIDGTDAGQPSKLTWKPGKALELPAGKTIGFLAPPPVGKDLNDLVQILTGLVEVAGIPSIMRGAGPGASGYSDNQRLAAASMAYKMASIALARQGEQVLELMHWMIPNVVRQTVYVQGWNEINPKTGRPKTGANRAWLGLSPDKDGANLADVTKLGPISMQFRPTLPTDEQARAMIAQQLVNAPTPLSSVRHALENYLLEEDPDSIMDEIAVEQALREDPLKRMVIDDALADAKIVPKQPSTNPAPAAQLVNPQGQPISSGMAGLPGAAQAGLPSVPGLNMPLRPNGGQAPAGGRPQMGRPSGMYPGVPSNQGV